MTSLVLELQRDALDTTVNVTNLLRKALVVSKKLNIADIQEWLSYELSGYPLNDVPIPDYRKLHGSPKVRTPHHGWQPLNFEDPKDAEALSVRYNLQPIGEIDDLASKENTGQTYRFDYSQNITNIIMKGMGEGQPSLIIPRSAIIGILDSVRNKILYWALELESQGVIGEGMSFTEKEKLAAHTVNYQVTTNIGNMTNSQLQQDSPYASQLITVSNDLTQVMQFIEALKGKFNVLELDANKEKELQAEVLTIETQLSSPNPKSVIVNESLKSIRSVLEGITGSLIATGLLTQLNTIF